MITKLFARITLVSFQLLLALALLGRRVASCTNGCLSTPRPPRPIVLLWPCGSPQPPPTSTPCCQTPSYDAYAPETSLSPQHLLSCADTSSSQPSSSSSQHPTTTRRGHPRRHPHRRTPTITPWFLWRCPVGQARASIIGTLVEKYTVSKL